MIFYLKPPPVIIDLRKFNDCCFSRFQFFINTGDDNFNNDLPESVTPGTKLDSVGHFILRCFCIHNPTVHDFIIKKETQLFRGRLEQYAENAYLMRKACKTVMRDIRSFNSYQETNLLTGCKEEPYFGGLVLNTLNCICRLLVRDHISEHFRLVCTRGCNKFKVEIPFQMSLSLVYSRAVELRNGIAIVPCSMWNKLLEELFTHHYEFGLSMISRSLQFSVDLDVRWSDAFKVLSTMYHARTISKQLPYQRLTAKMVDYEKEFFPPCMSHLLSVLRSHHRLSYAWRYRFSLFLKDIGLNVDESIEFWRTEYTKSCSAQASCKHSWKENQRKYRYSIRHMYGLEGSKRIGRSKRCNQIQEMQLGMRDEGGCPFVHFDDSSLLETMADTVIENSDTVKRILTSRAAGKPSEACRLHMAATLEARNSDKHTSDIVIEYESPLEYYFNCKTFVCESFSW